MKTLESDKSWLEGFEDCVSEYAIIEKIENMLVAPSKSKRKCEFIIN